MNEKKEEVFNLEEGIARLEAILARMEKEQDLPLDESLNLFQQGIELLQQCRNALAKAEYKVRLLLENGELLDFEEGKQNEQ